MKEQDKTPQIFINNSALVARASKTIQTLCTSLLSKSKFILTISGIIVFFWTSTLAKVDGNSINEVRTYLPYTFPVDPSKTYTITDTNIAYSLASRLVEWDNNNQISAGLAQKWEVISPRVLRFTLNPNVRWSDGTPVTSLQVKQSFERNIKDHPEELRHLLQILDSIDTPSAQLVDFKLKVLVQNSGLIEKLTEPNHGIMKINTHGEPDLSVSTGAFSLEPHSDANQLVLIRNPRWNGQRAGNPGPERIIIRHVSCNMNFHTVLLTDPWPNLIETYSFINADTQNQLIQGYETSRLQLWKAPPDKICFFHLGHLRKSFTRKNSNGQALIRFLRRNINPQALVNGLSGYILAEQFFPKGFNLYDPDFGSKATGRNEPSENLPIEYRSRPIEILVTPSRISPKLRQNIHQAILQGTGIAPRWISIPLNELHARRAQGDFDLYAGVYAITDPDASELLSYYLEGTTPIIDPKSAASSGLNPASESKSYLERLDLARSTGDPGQKLRALRSILTDAQQEGHIWPIFHFSTIGIARPELDLSQVPTSDEFVTFSKIRFRSGSLTETQNRTEQKPGTDNLNSKNEGL